MEIDSKKSYAVITGDIVGSTNIPPDRRSELHQVMKNAAKELRKEFRAALPLDIDIFSGDSWQMLVVEPWRALRIALYFRAYIQANMDRLDTRLAVAIGSIDFLPSRKVSEGDGEAFRLSGRLLSEKKQTSRMRFAAGRRFSGARVWDVAFHLLDALVTRQWTSKRARAMLGALQGWQQDRIAGLWQPPIRQQSVTKHLRGAEWDCVRIVLDEFERGFGGSKPGKTPKRLRTA